MNYQWLKDGEPQRLIDVHEHLAHCAPEELKKRHENGLGRLPPEEHPMYANVLADFLLVAGEAGIPAQLPLPEDWATHAQVYLAGLPQNEQQDIMVFVLKAAPVALSEFEFVRTP